MSGTCHLSPGGTWHLAPPVADDESLREFRPQKRSQFSRGWHRDDGMMGNKIIIGEGRKRERDEGPTHRLTQSNLDGREETAVLGTQRGRRLQTAHTTHTREVERLYSNYRQPNPQGRKPRRFFEAVLAELELGGVSCIMYHISHR